MKKRILTSLFIIAPLFIWAQRVSLGSCITQDGGQYKGEIVSGRPHGKGTTIYKNGDVYEGEYIKGKR